MLFLFLGWEIRWVGVLPEFLKALLLSWYAWIRNYKYEYYLHF